MDPVMLHAFKDELQKIAKLLVSADAKAYRQAASGLKGRIQQALGHSPEAASTLMNQLAHEHGVASQQWHNVNDLIQRTKDQAYRQKDPSLLELVTTSPATRRLRESEARLVLDPAASAHFKTLKGHTAEVEATRHGMELLGAHAGIPAPRPQQPWLDRERGRMFGTSLADIHYT